PARFAGSPVQLSWDPNTAKSTPALFKSCTKALVIFLALSSKLPAQPTQKRISGRFPSAKREAIVRTFICSSAMSCSLVFLGLVQTVHLVKGPRGPVVFHIAHHIVQVRGGRGLFHHQKSAHVHDDG